VTQHLGEIKMAKRVGKYKISKRESALNLTDGGSVDGNLQVTGTAKVDSTVTLDTNPRTKKFDLGAQVSLDPQSDGSIFSGATGEINQWGFRCGNTLAVHAIGTQTLLAPALNAAGLDVSGDQANNDGWAMRGRSVASLGALNKDYFTVGTSPAFFFKVKFSIADVSGIDDLRCGFAKVEAHNADPDDLDELATMAVMAGDIKTQTIINGASTVATDLTAPSSGDWADGATHTFKIMVSAAGVVTYELDDTAPTGAVAYTFDNGEVVTPYWFHRHDSDVGGAIIWQTFEFGLQ
tara:strand:+ start:34 stop:912 length:879 start_codon:yes stop_codon:yes gene_type:complete